MDEYYFWLVNTQFYAYTDQTDAQDGGDASFTGSYQFGFQDSYYDQYQQQSARVGRRGPGAVAAGEWQPSPAVRLAWCRVHNGQFGQPRRSPTAVAVSRARARSRCSWGGPGTRCTSRSAAARRCPPGTARTRRRPGFRYDLPPDEAVALPQVLAPPAPPATSPYPGGLPAYPFFAYYEPGRALPRIVVRPALAVADALRAHCRFELALRGTGARSTRCSRTAPGCTVADCDPRRRTPAGPTRRHRDGAPRRHR